MTISKHLNKKASSEQTLLRNLTKESIFLQGEDFLYIPRDQSNLDYLFGESNKYTFTEGITIEMLMIDTEGFQGDGDFLTRFGVDLRDTAKFEVSVVRFKEELAKRFPDLVLLQPSPGDLIYHPTARAAFEITHIENEEPFWQQGIETVYKLSTKKFQYNNDRMLTGEYQLDEVLQNNQDFEDTSDNTELKIESNVIINFTEQDPFSENI